MRDTAIRVDHLSKRYRIGTELEPYRTLRDSISTGLSIPIRALRSLSHRNGNARGSNHIWALKDISFQMRRGEVVGVIGRNGAGKSTLLKILSRITEPTEGSAEIHGRVGSLLEVGTGFHPELTGRENIYLNGAILGMRKAEIEAQFDAIVAFAEVEKFIDTPVKRYSTGMGLRLAFSVAAHLEPEILLIDEVLAVGDMAFQKKCLGKMEEVAAQGRTVLFVSHNLGAIKELCQTCIVLDRGRIVFQGPVTHGLNHYSQSIAQQESSDSTTLDTAWGRVRLNGENTVTPVFTGQPFFVEASLNLSEDLSTVRLYCLVSDCNGSGVVHNFADFEDLCVGSFKAGKYRVKAEFPPLWLIPNVYTLYFKLIGIVKSGRDVRCLSERVILDITDQTKQSAGKIQATLIPPLKWSIEQHSSESESAERAVAT